MSKDKTSIPTSFDGLGIKPSILAVLKKIGIELGFNKKLTCHVARHTFATTSISLGIPIEVVSKLLGHTSIRTTQVYAKIVDSVKVKEMKKWDDL